MKRKIAMKKSVWDKLATKYDSLWVQKHSLSPTRDMVMKYIDSSFSISQGFTMLDVGCATGELLNTVSKKYKSARLFGLDKSAEMLKIAKAKNSALTLTNCYAEKYSSQHKFDIITCCHSFPYYIEKEKVLRNLSQLLAKDGKAIFIQASNNSFYDKFVMFFIEFTAEKADYLSVKDFTRLSEKYYRTSEVFLIKQRAFMPSIYGFVLEHKDENTTD